MSVNFNEIPILDLSNYENNKCNLAQQTIEMCEDVGFFYVKNHGINPALCNQIMQLSKQFFAQPEEKKRKIDLEHSPYLRGYTAKKGTSSERNECLRLGIDLPLNHSFVQANKPFHGPNPDYPHIPEFKKIINNYLFSMNKLANQLLELFAIGLNIQPDFFTKSATMPLSTLLLLRYSPMNDFASEIEGCRPHTDFHCLTILMQDEVGGLQVQNINNQWVDAKPIKDTFVVNIGDLFSHWTRGRFKATPHRVLRMDSRERYSIPYFFNVDYDTLIEPAAIDGKFFEETYSPILAGEHVVKRTQSVYINHVG